MCKTNDLVSVVQGRIINRSDNRGQVCLSFFTRDHSLETISPFTAHELEATEQSVRSVRTADKSGTLGQSRCGHLVIVKISSTQTIHGSVVP